MLLLESKDSKVKEKINVSKKFPIPWTLMSKYVKVYERYIYENQWRWWPNLLTKPHTPNAHDWAFPCGNVLRDSLTTFFCFNFFFFSFFFFVAFSSKNKKRICLTQRVLETNMRYVFFQNINIPETFFFGGAKR